MSEYVVELRPGCYLKVDGMGKATSDINQADSYPLYIAEAMAREFQGNVLRREGDRHE